MNIALGADGYGYELKRAVLAHLRQRGDVRVDDVGIASADADTPYYQTANIVAARVSSGEVERGILICGTGMGMSIIANKHAGVFAAVCENVKAAENSRSINNSNVLTLGGMVTSPADAARIVDAWLDTEFTQGWSSDIQSWLRRSMDDIAELEERTFKDS